MQVNFEPLSATGTGTVAVLVPKAGGLAATAAELDHLTGGLLARGLALAPPPLERGRSVEVVLPADAAAGFDRVVLVGTGPANELDRADAVGLGAALAKAAAARKLDALTVLAELDGAALAPADLAAALAEGVALRTYRFDMLKSRAGDAAALATLTVRSAEAEANAAGADARAAVIEGVHLCRDLVNRPASSLDTDAFVAAARALEDLGVEVEVLDRAAMAELGMGALLGVAQGSRMPPYTVLMRWRGRGDDGPPLALVGKGVVFDSGGLSLKPAKSMETMKCDMGGAACVVGALHALARRGAAANVVGAIGLVENMPSGEAYRPGDVVTSLEGKTIEVLNTDAEGRLVLADVLHYVQDRFAPAAMIDFATLTGAVIVALGHEHAGLFANDDALAEALAAAGRTTGETVWRLPLGDAYAKQLESGVADLKNIGRPGQAGSIVAAAFLESFVGEVPWAHIDLAGTSFTENDHPLAGKGATGWGVRLVDRLVAARYEAG
ncbi:MAG: leucyl aminopeptidase [Alphaproteobacteria bacterium]|jgi:leucyl aminopeptidase|nr:leucyl aminopeptidase [Alphaproteobacteria bacterium]